MWRSGAAQKRQLGLGHLRRSRIDLFLKFDFHVGLLEDQRRRDRGSHTGPPAHACDGIRSGEIFGIPRPRPRSGSRIIVAASLRDETPSLLKAEERWLLTVLSARNSSRRSGRWSTGDDKRQNLPLTGSQGLRPDLPALSAGNRDLTRANHSDDRRQRILGLFLQHNPVDPKLESTPHLGPAGTSTEEHRRDVLEPRADQAHGGYSRAVWPVRGDHHA